MRAGAYCFRVPGDTAPLSAGTGKGRGHMPRERLAGLGRPGLGICAGRDAHRACGVGRRAPDGQRHVLRMRRRRRCVAHLRHHRLHEIEALRSTADTGTSADKDGSASKGASASLVRGLADARLAGAIRAMHERPMHDWSVAELATEAALSRSTFFERFGRTVGVAPMEYLLAWRMALAKDLLRRHAGSVAEIAQRVGYNAASTFSAAFARHVGCSPTQYARGLPTEPASQLQG